MLYLKNKYKLVALLGLILSSCNNPQQDYNNVQKIKVDDTKDKVIQIMGSPEIVRKAPFDTCHIMYDYGIADGASSSIAVYLDTNGIVTGKSTGD